MLLGAASVPLSSLLQGAWVDGYAPVFAIMASTVGGRTQEERVQVRDAPALVGRGGRPAHAYGSGYACWVCVWGGAS